MVSLSDHLDLRLDIDSAPPPFFFLPNPHLRMPHMACVRACMRAFGHPSPTLLDALYLPQRIFSVFPPPLLLACVASPPCVLRHMATVPLPLNDMK